MQELAFNEMKLNASLTEQIKTVITMYEYSRYNSGSWGVLNLVLNIYLPEK